MSATRLLTEAKARDEFNVGVVTLIGSSSNTKCGEVNTVLQ